QERAEEQDHDRLDQDQPPGVVGQQLSPRQLLLRQQGRGHRTPPLIETTPPCPMPSVPRTRDPAELAGSHTTSSGRSATSTGSVISPRSVDTVTVSPTASAVFADNRATTARAVPARCGSSTCNDPSSSSCRQV